MQLVAFTVTNSRSIIAAKKVAVSNYSVLVGANNEGKSNILHALALAMETLENFKYSVRRDKTGRIMHVRPSLIGRDSRYNWQRDFPISKQSSRAKELSTEVLLEFQLSDAETEEFYEEIGSKLNGTLPISVRYSEEGIVVSVAKQGRGGASLTKKASRVAEYISKKVQFEYIPTIRTSQNAEKVISELLEKELSALEDDDQFNEALEKIEQLQRPVLDELEKTICQTVSAFLPSVKGVHINSLRRERSRAIIRSIGIEIDDGSRTSLERKGDGVKSLVALALMRHASEVRDENCANIVAIEEPEAHLHPYAIHELRAVLVALSSTRQVVLTTHSPQFVRPSNLSSTIIVENSKARPAKSISEVRDALGVRLSDNLQSARLVLIVEGSNDVVALRSVLCSLSSEIKNAIEVGDLVFDHLGGAGKLAYKISNHRAALTIVHCFLDGDDAGRRGVKTALENKLISEADYNLAIRKGRNQAEFEDLLDENYLKAEFIRDFNVDPTSKVSNSHLKNWSDVMKVRFEDAGKIWDKAFESRLKAWIANFVKIHASKAIAEDCMGSINALVSALEVKLRQ